MQKTSKILAVALALGTLPVAAFAQTPVGTVHVTDAGMPAVIDYCEELATMSPWDGFNHRPSHAQTVASGIYLQSIQLADCQRAGLV